jgi:S1-C subfamily serine protease
MRRLSLAARGLLLMLSGVRCFVSPAAAQTLPEGATPASELIVMIEGQLGGELTAGAGILFGAQEGRLYIATANHVVRRGPAEAQGLTVQLRPLPGEPLPATLLRHADRGLDLAVLSVQGWEAPGFSADQLPFDRLGDVGMLERGDPVYALGYPRGRPWQVNATPEVFSEQRGDLLYFESSFIAGGSSGGGLFNRRWELLGMVRADQPPQGVAVALDRLLETLGDWGYPIHFRTAAGIGGKWMSTDGRLHFDFKVFGEELLGTLYVSNHLGFSRPEFPKTGILEGSVSRDRVLFQTLTSPVGGVRIHHRGLLNGDEIVFISQREDGTPPMEFTVRRVPPSPGWIGVEGQIMTRDLSASLGLKSRDEGALVVSVTPGGPGDEAGLQTNDVILGYNGAPLYTAGQFKAIVAGTPAGNELVLTVERQGASRTVRVTVREQPHE